MNSIKAKAQKTIWKMTGILPTKLPTGADEFDRFTHKIFTAYDLPATPSYKNAIATMVMHLPPTKAYATPRYFAHCVKKAMANEVAYSQIQAYKEAEKAKWEQEKAKAEAQPTEASAIEQATT